MKNNQNLIRLLIANFLYEKFINFNNILGNYLFIVIFLFVCFEVNEVIKIYLGYFTKIVIAFLYAYLNVSQVFLYYTTFTLY